jgi:beta-lactamase class D
MPPCSTFKIPNALISLDVGAVTVDDNFIRRDRDAVPAQDWWPQRWDEDHDLTSAIRNSVLWYFQELARRVGGEEMQRQLDRLGYGNRDVSGGIDRFWLSSSLRISADEQVAFLSRLVRGELPFDPAHVAFVRRALQLDGGGGEGGGGEGDDAWALFGKTGSCELPDGDWVGWLVGWVERPPAEIGSSGSAARRVVYAFNVSAPSYREMTALRTALVRPSLADLGLLPPR